MRIKWLSAVRLMGLVFVLAYHYFQPYFTGGFIGVDILFTLSGFLITANWLDEYTETKAIDLFKFGRKRLYRIMPPLVLMILLVMPLTFFVKRDFVAGIGLQLTTALGFTTNLYEIWSGNSYESQFIPHLFLHTWSLAVEVQFYLIWGLLIWVLSKRKMAPSTFRGVVFVLSAVLFGISAISMIVRAFSVENVSLIYFSTLSRSFAFFLGSIVGTFSGIRETTSRFRKHVRLWPTSKLLIAMSVATGLLLLLAKFLVFNHFSTYVAGFLLASLLSAILIYGARVLSDQTPDLNEPKGLTILADLSYSVYLFHWPLYIIFGQLTGNALAAFLSLVFALILAGLSYYIVEPIVAGKQPKILGLSLDLSAYYRWGYGVVGFLVMITLGIVATAPNVGAFETNLLVSSLHQSDNTINRTHTLLAGDALAVSDVTILGDSVALRASSSISELLPEAQLDAAVSRDFAQAYDIFNNQIKTGTLSKTVVLAVGVNSLYNYETDLNQFITALPDGHRLILVTPYNTKDGRVPEVRQYELDLGNDYPFVTVADWYQTSVSHPGIWAGTDGVHFSEATSDGSHLYAETIQKAIQKASKAPAKGENKKSDKKK